MEKKFYWLKLKKDFFKRHDIRIIESLPNGKEAVLFYVKLMTESVDHDGELRFSEDIPYSADMLATITSTDKEVVKESLDILSKFNLVVTDEDGTIRLPKVVNMIGSASDTDGARRMRRLRAEQKTNEERTKSEQNVRTTEQSVTDVRTKGDESKSKRKSKSIDIKRNTKEKNVSLSDVLEELAPDEKLKKAFLDFIEMRKLIKKPLTPQALKLAIGKVSELSGGDVEKAVQIIDQSVLNNWQGLYPLKTESVGRSTQTSNPYSIDWNQFTGGQAQ